MKRYFYAMKRIWPKVKKLLTILTDLNSFSLLITWNSTKISSMRIKFQLSICTKMHDDHIAKTHLCQKAIAVLQLRYSHSIQCECYISRMNVGEIKRRKWKHFHRKIMKNYSNMLYRMDKEKCVKSFISIISQTSFTCTCHRTVYCWPILFLRVISNGVRLAWYLVIFHTFKATKYSLSNRLITLSWQIL